MPVAIITGASSGIGAALVRELHARGWTLGLVARRAELLEQIARELGPRVAWAEADVADWESLRAATARLEAELGPCDMLVANAGVGLGGSSERVDPLAASRLFRVNIDGVLNACLAVLPGMITRGRGQLAAVSSLAAVRGMPRAAPYTASKAAVSALMESLRLDLAPRGVSVSVIHPGFVESEMSAKNRFPMPFLMPAGRAARIIADGLARRKRRIDFPWQLALLASLARIMPDPLYERVMRRARGA